MTDQQRFDWIGGAGQPFFDTPNLDRLAASGVVFDRAYSGAATCVPARNSLLTGLQHNLVPKQGDSLALEEGCWTIAHALRAAGYETALIGRMHFTPMYADHGFETVRLCENVSAGSGYTAADVDDYSRWMAAHGKPDPRLVFVDEDGQEHPLLAGVVHTFPDDGWWHPTSWIEREAVRFLDERDHDRPLFLVVSFPHPHGPYDPPAPYDSLVDPDDVVLPTNGYTVNGGLPAHWQRELEKGNRFRVDVVGARRVRRVLAAVAGLVRQIDDALGHVLDRLDLDRSIVWFTSDHGDYGGHRGLYNKVPWISFEDLLRVPLVIGGAGAAAGTRCDVPVQTQDLALSLLDWAGLEPPDAGFRSRSIRPLVEGRREHGLIDRPLFAGIGGWYPTVIHGRYKLIAWDEDEQLLFDLEDDPGETRSRIDDASLAEVRDDLRRRLARQFWRTPPALPRFDRER